MTALALPLTMSVPVDRAPAAPRSVEEVLVDRARGGDGDAFGRLVAPHLTMLFRIARRAAGSDALAEDAVQNALTLAYRRLRSYQPGTSLRGWLATFAVKQAHTLLRAEQRRRRREEQAPSAEGAATPAELLDARRLEARVRAALEALPRKRREVALLRLDGGLDYAEIARAVGTTEASARVLSSLALKDLASALGVRPAHTGPGPTEVTP